MKLELMTERLLLRPLAECDLDLAIAILTNSAVMKHVGETCTVDQVIEEHPIAMRRCAGGCIGIWCVIDRSTGEKLGTTFLLPLPIEEQDTNWDLVAGDKLPNCEVEIGYSKELGMGQRLRNGSHRTLAEVCIRRNSA